MRDIEDARASLARHTSLAVAEWTPRAVLTRSFEKHPALWIGGAALAGLAIVRLALSPSPAQKGTPSNVNPTNQGRRLRACLLGPFITLARKSAMSYASGLFESYLQRRHQVSPNETGNTTV